MTPADRLGRRAAALHLRRALSGPIAATTGKNAGVALLDPGRTALREVTLLDPYRVSVEGPPHWSGAEITTFRDI